MWNACPGGLSGLLYLPLARAPHRPLVGRIWELRENATPHDAAYVALAEPADAVLLTADGGLADLPGARCAVELLG